MNSCKCTHQRGADSREEQLTSAVQLQESPVSGEAVAVPVMSRVPPLIVAANVSQLFFIAALPVAAIFSNLLFTIIGLLP